MALVKEIMTKIIQNQPEDASYEEIMRELVFERMVGQGLEDSRKGRIISDEEMGQRIRSWQAGAGQNYRGVIRQDRDKRAMSA